MAFRLQAVDPKCYFGKPGDLFQLPWPRGGIQAPHDRLTSTFRTGTGGYRVGRVLGGARAYALNWETLDVDSFAAIANYDHGHEGVGPFVLIDPSRINLLTVNQSSTTSDSGTVDDFTVATSNNTLASDRTTYLYRGPRALRWDFAETNPASTPRLLLTPPYSGWYGIPVVIANNYIFSGRIRGAGTDAIVTITFRITWYDSIGGVLSTNDGSGVATSSGAWATASVSAVAPAGCAYAGLELRATSSTVSNGSKVLVDQLQFEVGTAITDWIPGTGLRPVSITSFTPEQMPWVEPTARRSPTLSLLEVVG